MINITVDGKTLEAERGELLLELLQREGIKVPSLCHHKAVLPIASCRLCLVEITNQKNTLITTSCNYKIENEIKVTTTTKEVKEARNMSMELLLARSPGSEELKAYAKEMGIEKSRFKTRISEETNCILCGLCSRVCQEVMNVGAIGFSNRGTSSKIALPFDKHSEVCHTCGACEFVCPTKCITVEEICGFKPQRIDSEFDAGLTSRGSIYIPFPQAVPNQPVIDKDKCMYYLTNNCKVCEKFCTAEAIHYDQEDEVIKKNVGSIILSPGFETYKPPEGDSYGYRVYPNVLTSIEFERMLSASGPTKGHVQRISDNAPPKKIAWIQCVGSRDESCDHAYCSSVCCMYAIKEAIIAKEHQKGLETHIYFMDIRSFGKDFDKYYERSREEYGLVYRRCRIPRITQNRETKDLLIRYVDDDNKIKEEPYSMVVLSVGLQPCSALGDLGTILDVNLNEYGFIQTDAYFQTLTTKKGIYTSGAATEPKDIPESVTQASAAAADAAHFISGVRGTEITEKEYPKERDISTEFPKIGVIICHCGINIAGTIDVKQVAESVKSLPYVEYVTDSLYTCSQDSLESIKDKIKEHGLNRIVIASCTPRTHEPLFQDTLREAGLNPHLFELVNIRDQNSWVHRNYPEIATKKAIESVKMGIAKAAELKPVLHHSVPVINSALVIGGGIAGMNAALSIGDQGYTVHLIERENELGGHLKDIYLGAGEEDPRALLENTVKKIKNHAKITLHLETTIEEVTGYVGNFITKLKKSKKGSETIEHGVVIVATGGKPYEPSEFCYGKNPDIIKQSDLEKQLFENKENLKELKEVVMIQCVGSRNDEHPYCSRVCCSNALKNAVKLKKINPDVAVYILYRDIRSYGFREDKLYKKARNLGVLFFQFEKEREPKVTVKDGKIAVRTFERILGSEITFHPDKLILSTGIIPRENITLAQHLKVPLNAEGFYSEAHMKLRPVDFAVDGIFLCGLAHSPRFIEESILQAKATGARAATILSKEHLETKGNVSYNIARKCAGCRQCIAVCPYEAIDYDEERKVVVINEILCQGCGACTVACPSGASQQNSFTNKQILAMIDACLT